MHTFSDQCWRKLRKISPAGISAADKKDRILKKDACCIALQITVWNQQ